MATVSEKTGVFYAARPGRLMRAVAGELAARGLDTAWPEWDDSRCLRILAAGVMRSDLTLPDDGGLVEWDHCPGPAWAASPAAMMAIVVHILGGDSVPAACTGRGLTLKGAVGRTLREYGFLVDLEISQDTDYCEVSADIVVTSPGRPERGKVYLSDNGNVVWEWECCDGISPGRAGAEIADVVTGCIAGKVVGIPGRS
jgi:hypothetical protein